MDRRRMDELKEEVRHVERMKEDPLPRMAYVHQATETERKTTYEMARLHRKRHEKGGVGGRGLDDGGPG